MSGIRKRYCVFGCDSLVTQNVPFHQFPHPVKYPALFTAWVSAVGDKLKGADSMKIYKNKRLCDHHFEHIHKISGGRLNRSAIPSVNLNQVQQSVVTFVEADHSYCSARRERFHSVPMMDITNLAGPSYSAAETTVSSIPSGSQTTTCLSVTDKVPSRISRTKYDANETFAYLRNKRAESCARKVTQKQNEIRRLRQKLKSYKLRLQQVKKMSVKRNFERLAENMSESAKLFVRMQSIEGQKKKKGHRFTLDEKILSLTFYKKSPKNYQLMRKHFTLPSRKVLKTLLAQVKMSPGINEVIFRQLKATVSKLSHQDRLCTLIFDEMSISPQIQYNQYTDDLVGFENYGGEKTNKFANHALVFMVKGIKKNFKQPIAYYFVQSLQMHKLKEILKDVVTNVQATGLRILATVCDQGSANSSCINALISEAKEKYFRLGKEWRKDVIIINNKEIIPLFDVPHLIKGMRNNLLNKEMQYSHINELKNIKWEYFQWIYEADKSHGELRMLPKLTKEHIDPDKIKKMRVKNATQVFSHSMAVAADNLVARGQVPPECLNVVPIVLLLDKLFDSLNASCFSAPHGKKYRAAVKRNSPHHELWQEALITLKTIKFLAKKSDGSTYVKYVPTVNNFVKTIEGYKSLWQLLYGKYSLDAMLTRNFNQDPLENFFGGIRSLGARNIAPNCVGFEGAFKTLLLNNLSSSHSINGNCEEDSSQCLQSLSFFINYNNENVTAPSISQNILVDQPLNVIQNIESSTDSGADQRNYVCGWALTKCFQKVVKGCKHCKSKLLGNSDSDEHRFIRLKEYEKNKKWLCYPSDCLINCFREIQEITISFLGSDCYKKGIKARIISFVELFTDFSFMDCETHKEKLKECFLDTSINIIIYSWCRSINRILEGKIKYEGQDVTKKNAQIYHDKHKSIKNK